MSQFDIQGGRAIFEVDVLGDMLPLVCVKSWSLNAVADTKETTTDGSGLWKHFDYDRLSYSLSLTGLTQILGEDGKPTFYDLYEAMLSFLEIGFRLLYIDDAGNFAITSGQLIITNKLFDATPTKLLNSSVTLIGNGELVTVKPNETNTFTFKKNGVDFTSDNELTAVTRTYKISSASVISTTNAASEQQVSVSFRLSKSSSTFEEDYASILTTGVINTDFTATAEGSYWRLAFIFDYVPATVNKAINFLSA